MTTSLHYKSNLRDIFFNLFEVLDIGKTSLGQPPFGPLDEATAREALTGLDELARTALAASFVASDREPLHLDADGNVTLPQALKDSLAAFWAGGWQGLELPERLGGYGPPPTMAWACFELLSGSNPAVAYYLFGSFIARVIDLLGTESQKKRFVGPAIERHWGGAMVLTEPEAGSDVGTALAKAKHIEGDLWEITGVKRFITNGDFDATENILHLVLARPEGAGPGTKGLSMFIVPKFWVNEDGSLGARNGAYVTAVEKKMGIKASATCDMAFGDREPCRGFLVGEKHEGIRQMFHVIEQARMAVGVKSMATLSTGYLNALAYTKERVQGPDLARAMDKTAPRVTILHHPDVRRMLMMQKSHAEGMRALALFTASIQDEVERLGGHGATESAAAERLNDLLLPLVKGYSSEKAWEMLTLSLQCFGGSGYIQDHPIEQYLRDQKIDSLYEGTTHIQALDFFFRKVAKDGGATLQTLMQKAQDFISSETGGEALAKERGLLMRALMDLQGIFTAALGKVPESLYHIGLQGNRILFAVAEGVIGWLLLQHAAIALQKLPGASPTDAAFYQGKIASARFFCAEVLPGLTLTRKLVENNTLGVMEIPEEAF